MHSLSALTSDYLKVERIIDGDSIVVIGKCAGVELPISIRMLYLDTPEMRDGNDANPHGISAKNHLQRLLKPGDKIRLWTDDRSFQADTHGRVLAVVFTDKNICLQEYMIKHGYSVYWQRFGKMPDKQHRHWLELEKTAQEQKIGLWSNQFEWMKEKSGE